MASIIRERTFVATATPGAGPEIVASPFQFFFDGADNLRIEGWNSLAGTSLLVQGRFLSSSGGVQPFSFTVALTADRLSTARDFPMERGFMLNLVAVASGASPRIGQTFTRISVIRGLGGATVVLGTLVQGYVTAGQGRAWPGSPIESSLDAPGIERLIEGTTPAAGQNVSETVPTGARWQPLVVRTRLTTSAAAANRQPKVLFVDLGGVGYYVCSVSGTIGAGSTMFPFFSNGVQLGAPLATEPIAPIPVETRIFAGMKIEVSATNLQAADQFDQVRLLVREWLEVE